MINKDQKLEMMRSGKVSTTLMKMGFPTMIGMIVSALYSVVDAYFAGWLGTSQQGAIAIAFPIVQLILGLGMTFGTGSASYIARLLGKNDQDGANRTASTALFSGLAVGAFSIAIALCFLTPILRALGATDTILPFATDYAVIYIAGSIFNIFNVTMNNIVAAEGRTTLTMISMIMGGGLNVLLDPLFMFGLNMGLQGAAVATVVAQMITSFIFMWYIYSKQSNLKFSIHLFTFKASIYKEIFKVGVPVLIYQLLSSISMGMTSSAASVYGDSAVAAFGDAIRVMTLGTYVVFGFMKGFQPILGFNYGAKNYKRVIQFINTSLIWSTSFCVIAALVMLIFPTQLMSIFTLSDTRLIDIGAQALRANGVIFALFGFQNVSMSLFLATGKGTQGGILSIGRQGLFFIPAILLMPSLFGLNGLIWVQPVADICTVALSLIFMSKSYFKLRRLGLQTAEQI